MPQKCELSKNGSLNVMPYIPHDLPDLSSYLPKTGEYTVMISGKPMKGRAEGKLVVSETEHGDLDGQIDTDCSTLAKAKLIELAKLSSASTISMSDTSAYSQPNESDNVIPYEQFVGELKQKEDQENTADDCEETKADD